VHPGSADFSRPRRFPKAWILGCCLLAATPAVAQLAEGNERLALPRRTLDEPFETPVFVAGHVGFGGDYRGFGPDLGYGGSVIFRPGSPVNLLGTLFRWNLGTVFNVDHQELDGGGSWTAVELIARRYFGNRGTREVPVRLFLGAGTGGALRTLEGADEAGDEAHWTWSAEIGQEWYFKPTHMLFVKGQYRWFLVDGRADGLWAVQFGAGLRWP
jgi:hypothetical protein